MVVLFLFKISNYFNIGICEYKEYSQYAFFIVTYNIFFSNNFVDIKYQMLNV